MLDFKVQLPRCSTPRSLHNFKNSLKSSAHGIAIVESPQLFEVLHPFGGRPLMPVCRVRCRAGHRFDDDGGAIKVGVQQ